MLRTEESERKKWKNEEREEADREKGEWVKEGKETLIPRKETEEM